LFFNKNKNIQHQLSDEELITKFRFSHDLIYLGDLFSRYTALIYGVSLKYLKSEADAEDMTMAIFEKLIVDLKRYEIKNFSSWLYTLVKNECMMEFRKRAANLKKGEVPFKEQFLNMENGQDLHHGTEENDKAEILDQLSSGIESLSVGQRRCIELFYVENKSYIQVSKETNWTVNQVKSHIQNGKRNLKLYFENKKSK